ncbi:TIP41-like protein [Gryllus bimaculatus]|nr:TIP41-like protein [Gryllus bimaculatus]
MAVQTKSNIDIMRLPVNSEEHTFGDWELKFKQSHILHSKCYQSDVCGPSDPCFFCLYNRELQLPHMPDMVFPQNSLVLRHKTGCGIQFNALEALKRVCNGKQNLKVACADEWLESRQDMGPLEQVNPFDWTFTTDYRGTILGDMKVEATELKLDLNKLRQKEKILFYHDLTLYEDELHDNGTAVCSVKIRVMPNSFFILLRFFLRVDNVKIRINDTRIYHEFDLNYLLREYSSREANVGDLKVPHSVLVDPNEVTQFLPIVKIVNEKLIFPSPGNDDSGKSGS